mgnify:CR=1 FL=1
MDEDAITFVRPLTQSFTGYCSPDLQNDPDHFSLIVLGKPDASFNPNATAALIPSVGAVYQPTVVLEFQQEIDGNGSEWPRCVSIA